MQKITAFNQNNQALQIEIIRYFKQNDKKYLIFTLGEKDEQEYIKVYVSKILELNDSLAAYDIVDETEWANIKELIKKVIKANREGAALEITDLSTERLNNIKVNGQQVFKLIGNLIELLGSNVNAVSDEQEVSVVPAETKETNPVSAEQSEVQSSNDVNQEVVNNESQENSMVDVSEEANDVKQTGEQPETQSSDYKKMYTDLFEQYQKLLIENTELKTNLETIKSIILK